MAITYSVIDNAIPESAFFARQTLFDMMEEDAQARGVAGGFPAWNDPAPKSTVDAFAPYLRKAGAFKGVQA